MERSNDDVCRDAASFSFAEANGGVDDLERWSVGAGFDVGYFEVSSDEAKICSDEQDFWPGQAKFCSSEGEWMVATTMFAANAASSSVAEADGEVDDFERCYAELISMWTTSNFPRSVRIW
jgi:hypothetical protein